MYVSQKNAIEKCKSLGGQLAILDDAQQNFYLGTAFLVPEAENIIDQIDTFWIGAKYDESQHNFVCKYSKSILRL